MLPVLGAAVALAVCEAAAVVTSTAGLCTRHWRPNRRPKKLDGGDLGLPPPRPNENNTVKTMIPVKPIPVEAIPVQTIPVTGSKKVFGEIGGGASGGGGGGKGGNAGGGVGEKPAHHGGAHGYHGGDHGHGYGGGGWGDSGGDGGSCY